MGIFDAVANIVTGNRARKVAQDSANEQMHFQSKMSNTAHQREVADLKAAGLNPILSAGGGGASSPTGAAFSMPTPDIRLPDFTDIMALSLEKAKVDNQTRMVDLAEGQQPGKVGKLAAETNMKKAQERLAQKGVIKADIEGKAAKGLEWLWQRAKENYNDIINPKSEPQKESSGGNLP